LAHRAYKTILRVDTLFNGRRDPGSLSNHTPSAKGACGTATGAGPAGALTLWTNEAALWRKTICRTTHQSQVFCKSKVLQVDITELLFSSVTRFCCFFALRHRSIYVPHPYRHPAEKEDKNDKAVYYDVESSQVSMLSQSFLPCFYFSVRHCV
jgi:hypothetical protein